MRSEIESTGQRARTFIDEARRAQLVQCTVDVLADIGFARTSMAEIARRAGVSKGVISYHFKGKDELIQEVVAQTLKDSDIWLESLLALDAPAGEKLRRYATDTMTFLKVDQRRFKAFMEVFLNYRRPDGNLYYDDTIDEKTLHFVEAVLVQGQERGEFRAFDPHIMALCLRGMVDSAAVRLIAEPGLDVDAFGSELMEIFDRSLRADHVQSSPEGGG